MICSDFPLVLGLSRGHRTMGGGVSCWRWVELLLNESEVGNAEWSRVQKQQGRSTCAYSPAAACLGLSLSYWSVMMQFYGSPELCWCLLAAHWDQQHPAIASVGSDGLTHWSAIRFQIWPIMATYEETCGPPLSMLEAHPTWYLVRLLDSGLKLHGLYFNICSNLFSILSTGVSMNTLSLDWGSQLLEWFFWCEGGLLHMLRSCCDPSPSWKLLFHLSDFNSVKPVHLLWVFVTCGIKVE